MKRLHNLYAFMFVLLLMACSTTRNLPEVEQLYIGQKAMILENTPTSSVGETALTEIEAALATAPVAAPVVEEKPVEAAPVVEEKPAKKPAAKKATAKKADDAEPAKKPATRKPRAKKAEAAE